MKNFAEKVIKKCEGEKRQVKYIRIDGGGENKGIEDLVEDIGGINIEKTPPNTPQYNGRIERRFSVIISMAMAMIWSAGFTKDMKKRTFNLAVETAIFLNDIAPTTRNKIPAYELWNNKPSHWKIVDLKEFGRIGIVKIKDKERERKRNADDNGRLCPECPGWNLPHVQFTMCGQIVVD